ncbi:MAG: ORF6N domain-containing protein [Gemmatimonadaceae bacterium]
MATSRRSVAPPPAVSPRGIEERIHLIRGHRVMLDSDLAALYGVRTKALNQAVSRNVARFPTDFAFQLTAAEQSSLRSQIVTSNGRGGARYAPR